MKIILFALLMLLCAYCAPVFGEQYPPYHACMTEPTLWVLGDLNKTEERFRIYKENNVDMLRIEGDWRAMELEEGKWDASRQIAYIRLAHKYGFKIKLILGVMMAPPRWFLEKTPDARIVDEDGVWSPNTMSYCWPGLHRLIQEKTDKIVSIFKEAGVWDDIVYVIPTFGPAGEPIYPHPWTMGAGYEIPRYWNYEPCAQALWRTAMKKKYHTVEKANSAWGTDFESLDTMPLLKSGEKPGAYWNDYLTWYRDVKRDFIRWQIKDTFRVIKDKNVLVYIPGTAYNEALWQDAVNTAQGEWIIKMMCDSMWVMEEALRQGAALQYTGCDNGEEVDRLRAYLDSRGHKDAVMWGENAGYFVCAKDPLRLADICVRNRLYGLDYTHSHFAFTLEGAENMPDIENFDALFNPDIKITPHPVIMPQLKAAFGILRDYNTQMNRIRKQHQKNDVK